MRVETVRDDDANTVTITLRCSADADPDTTADHAWSAVDQALAHNRRPCSCGDTGWVHDEGWEPLAGIYGSARSVRAPGAGLIPCGFCNEGGWDRQAPPC